MTPSDMTLLLGVGGVPVIVAIVEGVKRVFPALPDRWFPLVSLAVGMLLNVGVGLMLGQAIGASALAGLVAALAASGLYSGTRAVAVV